MKKRFRVKWEHRHPMWADVYAENEQSAILTAASGQFIEGTMDADPGLSFFGKAKVKELSEE